MASPSVKRLKEDPETLLIPVVFITALDQIEDGLKGVEAGADDFLIKPIRAEELLVRVRALLQKKQAIERQIVQHGPDRRQVELVHSMMFEGLTQATLNEIVGHMRPRHFDANEFLCRQGERGASLFVIQYGLVEVFMDSPEAKIPVDRLRRGDVVGEIAVLTGDPHIASVMAVEPTDTLEIRQETVTSLVSQYPTILHYLSRLSIERQKRNAVRSAAPGRLGPSDLVFISYSSSDKETAEAVCQLLEARGISCWIAPRDIPAGAKFVEAIVRAIDIAVAVVLIFSEHANTSEHVMNEVERAVNRQRRIFPLRIESATPVPELAYFISRIQWLDANTESLETVTEMLATVLHSLVSSTVPPSPSSPAISQELELRFAPEDSQEGERVSIQGHAPSTSPASDGVADWDTAVLNTVAEHLVTYLGPIAKILVRREANKASTLAELYQSLASHIPIEQEKAIFLRDIMLRGQSG
jgi:CRP-like cAMP-binding protein